MFAGRQIKSKLDEEILAALEELSKHESTSEEYGLVIENIAKLHKLKSEEGLKPPSMDTVLAVGANIFGILWLARYERENVIRAKSAFGLLIKPR